MNIPYNWDFLQDNIFPEKLAELRKKFIEEWRSGDFSMKEMIERYRMSERTFWTTIKKYVNAEELADYMDESRTPHNHYRKFSEEEYNDVLKTFENTRKEVETRFTNFMEDMKSAGKNLSPPKIKGQKKKMWVVRSGVRRIKVIVEKIWKSSGKIKSISKSYVNNILRKFGKYPEDKKKKQPAEFIRPEKPGEKFSIDTGTRYMGDKTQVRFQPIYDDFNSELVVLIGGSNCDHDLTLKALNELRQMYPNIIIQIRSDGGKEFENKDVITFFENNKITWKKISKPYDNPFAERGIRTLKHEYFDQIWIGNFDEFEKIISIVKSHYNESRPHQSFENKTPLEVRMEATDNKKNYSPPQEMEKWDTLCRTILNRTNTAIC